MDGGEYEPRINSEANLTSRILPSGTRQRAGSALIARRHWQSIATGSASPLVDQGGPASQPFRSQEIITFCSCLSIRNPIGGVHSASVGPVRIFEFFPDILIGQFPLDRGELACAPLDGQYPSQFSLE